MATEPERSAVDFFPKRVTLRTLTAAVQKCRGCDLYRDATQAVFGEGPPDAEVMLVGEQPGDREDVVKHFKWKAAPRGKRRIHRKPDLHEVQACRPWLEAEIERIEPVALVLMGATAAQAMFGRSFRVTRERGTFLDSPLAPVVTATVHPSSILRARDEDRERETAAFVADLIHVARKLEAMRASGT
jgi:uracil-DNA glycosylase